MPLILVTGSDPSMKQRTSLRSRKSRGNPHSPIPCSGSDRAGISFIPQFQLDLRAVIWARWNANESLKRRFSSDRLGYVGHCAA